MGLKVALLVACACLVERFCKKQTSGFSLTKIQSHFVYDPRWEISPLKDEEKANLNTIFNQSFRYLGKGAQCYAFVSDDGSAVIKFLRVSHLEAPWALRQLPLPSFLKTWQEEKIGLKKGKRERDFTSYTFAYEKLKEETGLIFLHLNKSSDLNQKIRIIDKLGIAHMVDLDQMEFILQKRATPFYPAIEEMLALNQKEKIKEAMAHLIQLLEKRRSVNLADKDPDLTTNFGFIDGVPIQFDIGRFQVGVLNKKNEPFRNETIRITASFKKWLEKRDSELARDLEEKIQAIPETLFPEKA